MSVRIKQAAKGLFDKLFTRLAGFITNSFLHFDFDSPSVASCTIQFDLGKQSNGGTFQSQFSFGNRPIIEMSCYNFLLDSCDITQGQLLRSSQYCTYREKLWGMLSNEVLS